MPQLADHERWEAAYRALDAMGERAVPALCDGLRHERWEVRRWCLALLDHNGGPEVRPLIVPLLEDERSKVRLFAVHALACDRCAAGENPVDVLPYLVAHLWNDPSIRVRRMAAAMVAEQKPDGRVVEVCEEILKRETDRKLRVHAAHGLWRCRRAGITGSETH